MKFRLKIKFLVQFQALHLIKNRSISQSNFLWFLNKKQTFFI